MANDRIYLQCNTCGKKLYLGKSYGDGFYWTNYGKLNGSEDFAPLEDRLNVFFDEHIHPEVGPIEHWDGDYSIVYEADNIGDLDKKWESPHTKHGHWIKEDDDIHIGRYWGMKCSVCGAYTYAVPDDEHYCYNCGAKMDVLDTNVGNKKKVTE